MKRAILIIAPIVVVLAAGGIWLGTRPKAATSTQQGYQLSAITRGSLESVVSSSGTLAPVSEISVLSQMSGRVEKVYTDYNELVKKGQVLAQINTDMLKLQELESQAAVKKAKANYDLYLLDYQNKSNLYKKGLVSEYDYQSSKTNLGVYEAELSSAQAALKVIETELNQYALITSPIDGIVIDKNVEAGQSVVEGSSSNATSLFTLAEDLSNMEIKAEVDELDISSIKVGQEVRFTVEANPSTTYTGTVHQIRLVPETTNNVVTYYVMINAKNRDGSLLPGMTANIEFIKERKTDVAIVPTAALRFQPTGLTTAEIARMVFLADLPRDMSAEQRAEAEKAYDEQVKNAASTTTTQRSGGLTGMMMPGPPPGMRRSGGSSKNGTAASADPTVPAQNRKSLWYLGDDGKPAVLRVTVGASDSTNTEIVGGDSLIGRKIIVKVKVE